LLITAIYLIILGYSFGSAERLPTIILVDGGPGLVDWRTPIINYLCKSSAKVDKSVM
jgi:hypothetical protein